VLTLISVHVPKCAGTAFRAALERAYGAGAVLQDYGDRPFDPAAPMHLDPDGFFAREPDLPAGVRVVHGHFHAAKYRRVGRGVPRIAVLRHPVARTVSHYHYWRRLAPGAHALHAYMRAAELDLLAFARLPFIRHAYGRVMFAGLSRRDFDFVGAVETLERDLGALSVLLGCRLEMPVENVSPEEAVVSPAERAALDALLAEDIALYEGWVASGPGR
jgi:hypothetical protein